MTLYTFDTEDDSKGHPTLYNFYDVKKNQHHTFRKQNDAIDFVCSKPDSQFWAVNLEYDINNLFRDHFGMLRYTYAGSRLLFADLVIWDEELQEHVNEKIRFLDTLNHWQGMSVKKMGERIGMPKLEYEHLGSRRVTKKLVEYCQRDTEITGRFLATMDETYRSIGMRLKPTIASTTLDFFERHFYRRVTHPFTEEQIDFFHTGYYGGRVEIFYNKPITGKIWYHDINSLYPWALKTGTFPVLSSFRETSSPDFTLEGMADCDVSCPETLQIPYLPCRFEGKKLIFPTGNFRGTYTFFEIRRAQTLGYQINRVHRAIQFTQVCNPFSEFVTNIYERRLKAQASGDSMMSDAYKALLNYCYGKFAQKNESVKLLPAKDEILKGGDTLFGDLVFRRETIAYPRYANCVWACYVTAFARDRLYRSLNAASQRKRILLYCDTDSIVYESKKSCLEDSKELGKFKLVGVYDYAYFKLPKLYVLRADAREYYKAKGVPSRVAKQYFDDGIADFNKPNKLRETLRRNFVFATGTRRTKKKRIKLIPNYWELRHKEIKGKYDKRVVLKTGHTKPIHLGV